MNGKERNVSDISIQRVSGAWHSSLRGYKSLIALWCGTAIQGKHKGELAVVLADNAFVQNLNHQFRGLNKPTNVLSFPGNDGELGDIILAYETVRAEARAQKKTFQAHTAHLVVHGCLHLLGYDHEKPSEANIMEMHEIKILSSLGIANPYIMN